MRAVRNVFPSARFVVFSTLEEVCMKTNRTKRSVFFCRAAALIALAAVCMIGCQNATDGSDKPAVERYFVDFYTDGWHGGALTAKVDGKEIHSGDRVEQGKIVEFTAQPESGKRADTWFIEGGSFEAGSGTAGSDTAKVRVLNNISVRVSFKDVEAGKHIVRFGIEGNAGESRLSAAVAGGTAILSGNEVSDGSVVEFTARPESGKTVDRWFIEGGNFEAGSGTAGSDTARVKVSGNINVRVAFKDADPNKHIVTFGIEGSAGESAVTAKVTEGWRIASGNEVSDGAFVEFTAVPAPGYKVKSWTIVKTEDNNPLLFEEGGTGGSLRAKARAACNLTVKVEFERIIYTIVFGFEGSSEQGTFTAQKDGAEFVSGATAFYGEELAFSARPKAGWKVAVWTIVKTDDSSPLTFEEGGAEGSLSAKAKVTCNITVKVKFEKIICTVSFTVPGGHGSLKAKPEGADFVSGSPIGVEYGKTVEFTASPAAGYKVKAWTIVNTDSGSHLEFESGTGTPGSLSAKAKVFSPVTVRVEFEKTYTVVFTVPGGHGSLTAKIEDTDFITGSPMNVGHGKTVEFTAAPNAGYKVKEWTVNGAVVTAGSTYRLTVVQDVHLIVTFTEDNVRITISGDERVDEGGYIDITRGKRWGDVKTDIGKKIVLKEKWQGGDYGAYQWKLNGRDGNTIDDNYIFTADTIVYIVTNYIKFKMQGTVLSGYNGEKPEGLIIIGDTVTQIGSNAFSSCFGLTGVDFSACTNLTQIGSSAFEGCMGLSGQLRLPVSLTEIGDSAFKDCKGIVGKLELPPDLKQIGREAFSGCERLTGGLELPAGLSEIGYRAFYACGLSGINFSACTNLKRIGSEAFSSCTRLSGVLDLPPNLIEIGGGAFYMCRYLMSVKLPANLKIIGGYSFQYCTNIRDVNLSDCNELTKIGEYAFAGCENLRTLNLPASITEIGSSAFSGCFGISGELKLPSGLTKICSYTFFDCMGLTKVDFSDCTKLTKIEERAFKHCITLGSVDLYSCTALTQIAWEAFKNCKHAVVRLPESITQLEINAFGDSNETYCAKVKIKGGSEYSRIYDLVVRKSHYFGLIEQY